MKKIVTSLATAGMVASIIGCTANNTPGTTTTPLTDAGKMGAGIGNSTTAFQSLGTALGGGARSVHSASAADKCDEHAAPGLDANANGSIESGERYSTSDTNFGLQSFYCALASDSNGPEAVSGAVKTLKTVICAVEKQLGTLTFNTTATVQSVTSLTFDTTCASQHFLDDMGASGAATVTIPVTSASITTQANPNFTEVSTNTHYSHGFKFQGVMNGNLTTFIILAKFDPSFSGDPLESGDFEFMTMGTGMQGTAVETTAGKIQRSSSTAGRMWYEFKANRQKSSVGDAICPNDSSSCGWARHIRIATDIEFASDDISNIANFTGVIADSNDDTGSGGSGKQSRLITATGALSTGLTGKVWTSSGSALDDMNGTTTVADLSAQTTTCVIGSGTNITTVCGAAPAYLNPGTTPIQAFFLPPNTTTSLVNATTKGGIGFTGAATLANDQYVNP